MAAAGLALALFGRGTAAGEAADPMLVVLRSNAPVKGVFIQLGDVADLPNDPHRLREFARDILLGFAPGSGAVRELGADEIAVRLREAGIPEALFCVKGAPRIAVFAQDGRDAAGGGAGELPATQGGDAGADDGPPARVQRAAAARSFEPPPPPKREARRPATPAARAEAPARPPAREGGKLTTAKAARDVATGPGLEGREPEKGEILVLRTTGQALSLEEPVRVVGSGPTPDVLEVQNIRTGKKLLARVLDRGVVVRAEGPAGGERGE
jgi:hypothetical protein